MKRILIAGAGSAIAEAFARRCAARGDRLFLLARDRERLAALSADLVVRGAAGAVYREFDANVLDAQAAALDAATADMGGIDIVLVAWGTLPDQQRAQHDAGYALAEFATNGTSVIHFATLTANRLQAGGTLAVISSVAGDRGRQSNYLYGAAKGSVTIFLAGLRNHLFARGIQVLTVKPGFVDTPMTRDFPKGPLWASADQVAAGIDRAIDRRRDVAYLPGFWLLIMLVIRHIPERIFKRLKL